MKEIKKILKNDQISDILKKLIASNLYKKKKKERKMKENKKSRSVLKNLSLVIDIAIKRKRIQMNNKLINIKRSVKEIINMIRLKKFNYYFNYINKEYIERYSLFMPLAKLRNITFLYSTGQINWGEYSSHFSKEAIISNYKYYEYCIYCRGYGSLYHDCNGSTEIIRDVETLADLIHRNWCHALQITRYLLDLGFELDGQSYEKTDSQHHLLIDYKDLERVEQLKDIYCIKTLTPEIWNQHYKTDQLLKDFESNNINW